MYFKGYRTSVALMKVYLLLIPGIHLSFEMCCSNPLRLVHCQRELVVTRILNSGTHEHLTAMPTSGIASIYLQKAILPRTLGAKVRLENVLD